jgi:receptor expression-enhancing protein 5/6
MEKVVELCRPLNKYGDRVPQLVDLSKKAGLPTGVLLAAVLVVASILTLVLFGGTILSVIFTVLYPSIQSIKAIESEGENDDKEWLTYWTIFGLFHLLDEFGGFVLSFVPFYFYIRIAFFVFLMAPQTKGALTIYKYLVGPILKQHKASIQAFIDEVKGSAGDAISAAKEQAKKELADPNRLMQAAQLANQASAQLNTYDQ